jgi:hypothetical protein
MAYWFLLMARDFYKDTGCTLHAASALRFGWEQEQIFRDRYVPWYEVNGRRVYDYRWWNGVQWARISSAGTVAVPKTSNHEFESTGIGAVDIYDSGNDAGVTSHGSFRANWYHANSWKYHYDSEGDNFGEEWHKRFLGNLNAYRPNWDIRKSGSTAGSETSTPSAPITQGDDDMAQMFYYNKDDKRGGTAAMFALAGGSPGTPANWLEITDPNLANQLAIKNGNAVFLSKGTWAVWKKAYLTPVSTDEIEPVPAVEPPKA